MDINLLKIAQNGKSTNHHKHCMVLNNIVAMQFMDSLPAHKEYVLS